MLQSAGFCDAVIDMRALAVRLKESSKDDNLTILKKNFRERKLHGDNLLQFNENAYFLAMAGFYVF